jgi:hypothetical protein
MLVMNRPASNSMDSSRRFLLLPEEGADTTGQRPAIRRYRLTSIGRRTDLSGADLAAARIAGEFARMGRLRR